MANQHPTEPDPAVINDEDSAAGLVAIQDTYGDWSIGETLILDGYGINLRVSRGELELIDGIAQHRRTRRVPRATAAAGRVRRILVLGTGAVSTDATAWCQAMRVALIIAGPHGEPLSVGAAETFDHAALRRAQALAAHTPTGMDIVRYLLGIRLADQARISTHLLQRSDRGLAIAELASAIPDAGTPQAAMVIEMQAAQHYWAAWDDEVRIRFAANDRPRVPSRWAEFGGRSSPLGEAPTNRHAGTPLNALINYGTRLAEIEATIACRALGLDPAMGLAHANGLNRPAMVLDLIEPARAIVEEATIALAAQRAFRKADFAELATGEIRILAPLSHDLAKALLPRVRRVLGPVVEHVAHELASFSTTDVRVPTALTGARRRTAPTIATQRTRERATTVHSLSAELWACPNCGGKVSDRQLVRCEACMHADPRQTVEVRGRRARAIAGRRTLAQAWEAGGGAGTFDPDAWPAIQATLVGVKLADIVSATGLSKSFASVVRAGKSKPHPSLWPTLMKLGQVP